MSKRRVIHSTLACILLAASIGVGCGTWSTSRAPDEWFSTAESRKLHELFDGYFEEYLRLYPVFATSVGDHRYDDQLGDGISEEHRERERLFLSNYLSHLSRLEREKFHGQDRLSYDLFERQLILRMAGLKFSQHLLPVRQLFSSRRSTS